MAVFTEVAALIPTLGSRLRAGASLPDATALLVEMSDAEVVAVLREAVEVSRFADQVRVVAAGVIADRSSRSVGHSGLAQSRGHRSPTSLLQELTGSTKAEASRDVRVGQALLEGDAAAGGDGAGAGGGGFGGAGVGAGGAGAEGAGAEGAGGAGSGRDDGHGAGGDPDAGAESGGDGSGGAGAGGGAGGSGAAEGDDADGAWFAPLTAALREGRVTAAQFDAIKRGLGEPALPAPAILDPATPDHAAFDPATPDPAAFDPAAPDPAALDPTTHAAACRAARDAWRAAAEQLIREAPERTVEELGAAARRIRDLLDPEGAEARFRARYEKRSLRSWVDLDGARHAHIVFDDEGGAFQQAVFDAALRPRRGGPRFVDAEEKSRADALVNDARTNEQLAYDLFLDLLRAGVLADAKTVFGTRQAGVRIVHVQQPDGTIAPTGHTEDGLISFPAATTARRLCDSGHVPVTVDACGNPLDVGREHRLFTPVQRIALAIRDGGCRWRGCDRPASYCEAHHIDEWAADGGRTDIDRGILLCRFHHMTLHHGGWRITREGTGDFTLQHPDGHQSVLRPRGGAHVRVGRHRPPTSTIRSRRLTARERGTRVPVALPSRFAPLPTPAHGSDRDRNHAKPGRPEASESS